MKSTSKVLQIRDVVGVVCFLYVFIQMRGTEDIYHRLDVAKINVFSQLYLNAEVPKHCLVYCCPPIDPLVLTLGNSYPC